MFDWPPHDNAAVKNAAEAEAWLKAKQTPEYRRIQDQRYEQFKQHDPGNPELIEP